MVWKIALKQALALCHPAFIRRGKRQDRPIAPPKKSVRSKTSTEVADDTANGLIVRIRASFCQQARYLTGYILPPRQISNVFAPSIELARFDRWLSAMIQNDLEPWVVIGQPAHHRHKVRMGMSIQNKPARFHSFKGWFQILPQNPSRIRQVRYHRP
tara:strand:+ start:4190 stop:4660 length:471 start_codon:yes stop_codon:yes gene_type:complete